MESLRTFLEKLLTGQYIRRPKAFDKHVELPGHSSLSHAYRLFSATERMVFMVLTAIMVISAIVLVLGVNHSFLVSIPSRGGTLTEGIVGTPRFINPVLAVTDADKDLVQLVYAGLLQATPDGNYKNLLAQSVDISSDGKTYTVTINKKAKFQDGTPVTADDVIFTINKIEDPIIKSPQMGNWSGVDVKKIDDYTIAFNLKQSYAPFLENLTIGILPKHIWDNVSSDEFAWSDLNLNAVGAGPYKVTSVSRDSSGIPSKIALKAFSNFINEEPYITNINTVFFNNEDKAVSALISGSIDSFGGISPTNAAMLKKRGFNVLTATLPRVFGLFFNQNQNKIFADKSVRDALDLAAPRESIVSNSLMGFGQAVDGPIPDGIYNSDSYDVRMQKAATILDKDGYVMATSTGIRSKTTGKGKTLKTATLAFSIATADAPDLVSAAHALADSYKTLGFDVTINVFESGDLQQNIIRSRNYDALLFGEVVGRDKDLYPFWHSSERLDPGLNIAMYTNSTVDKLLDKLRQTSDTSKQQDILTSLLKEFNNDIPAAFLYAPQYVYVIPKSVKRVELGTVNNGSERFLNVSEWYIETDTIWKIFVNQPVSS